MRFRCIRFNGRYQPHILRFRRVFNVPFFIGLLVLAPLREAALAIPTSEPSLHTLPIPSASSPASVPHQASYLASYLADASIQASAPHQVTPRVLQAVQDTLSNPIREAINALKLALPRRKEAPKTPARPELVQSILDDYRPRFDQIMGDTLTVARDTLGFGRPESAIGDFAADALRFRAARELAEYVHIGVLDEGSLQRFFLPGPITLAGLYELMPYENTLVVLTLDGDQVKELARQIAERGGGPVSGMRMSIRDGSLGYLLVNRSTIDPEKTYLIATSSYLASGFGPFPALWQAQGRIDTQIGLRQVFIDAFSSRPGWASPLDQRIIGQGSRP